MVLILSQGIISSSCVLLLSATEIIIVLLGKPWFSMENPILGFIGSL
jgi:hypothetical protein